MSGSHDERLSVLLEAVLAMAAGELDDKAPLSSEHDFIDAVSYGVNVLVDELRFATERLSAAKEVADEANRQRNAFLRNVTHEIRTPLSAIVSFADLLATTTDDARKDEYVRTIQRNALALRGVVDDFLDLTKIEADRLDVFLDDVPVRDLLNDVTFSLEPQATQKGIHLKLKIDESLPRRISTDGTRLRQVLMNVVGNAVKFTDRGYVEVRAFVAPEEKQLVVDVTDTGVGIGVATRQRLFEAFGQGEDDPSRSRHGSGLGLLLSRALVERMGGSLELVWSEPDKGSTFRITLPGTSGRSEEPAPIVRPPRLMLRGLRLLIAEDNVDICMAMGELLEDRGCFVETVPDGLQAVEKALAVYPDVVLMDLQMPRLDGVEAARRLRVAGFDRPILALTAEALIDDTSIARLADFDDRISKPISFDQLAERLAAYLPR